MILATFVFLIGASLLQNINRETGKTNIQITDKYLTNSIKNDDYVNAFWKFNEYSGNIAYDPSWHDFDGTYNGTTWFSSGYALNSDGIKYLE